MAVNTVQMWSNGIEILLKCDWNWNGIEMWSNGIEKRFCPKTYKIRPAAGGEAPTQPVIRLSTPAYSTRLLS